METLIRRCILWRLIWVCTICLCPTKRTLGIYWLKCNYFAYFIRVAEIWEVYCWIIFLGTSDLSKFINMKIKERQCHITKQLVHSFSVNIRISQPSKVMFTSALPRWTSLFSGWQILMLTSKECINCIMANKAVSLWVCALTFNIRLFCMLLQLF